MLPTVVDLAGPWTGSIVLLGFAFIRPSLPEECYEPDHK
jgi:hypothetical protein